MGRPPKVIIDPDWCKRCQEREALPNPRAPLVNPKHEKFCRNVALLSMDNGEAYTGAGFGQNKANASSKATKLRKRLDVQARLIVLSELAIDQDLSTRKWVHSQLKEVVTRCMQKEPVIVDGKETGMWKFDARGTNTALQLMGKDLGMFVERLKVSTEELHDKTPEEIAEMLIAAAVDLGRDTVRRMGEAVGLFEKGSNDIADPIKTPTVEAVSTVQ